MILEAGAVIADETTLGPTVAARAGAAPGRRCASGGTCLLAMRSTVDGPPTGPGPLGARCRDRRLRIARPLR
eukprot:8457438-Alexandrium_andersonii.AAC.1